jgi:quercetin dioxygenase-like cupin family protein
MNENFGTLSEAINGLINLGYTHDFNIQDECPICHRSHIILSPNDFQIDEVYRFEGVSDPEYQSILYAISSTKFNIKGTLVNGYGIYSDEKTSKLVEMLPTNQANKAGKQANEASPQRPDGSRVLEAQLLEMNLHKYIDQIKNEATWANSDRNSITIFKSEAMRMVLIGLHKNAVIKPHKANGVISVQVLSGQINFMTDQQNSLLEAGQMIALQANITHSVAALSESFLLLTLAVK